MSVSVGVDLVPRPTPQRLRGRRRGARVVLVTLLLLLGPLLLLELGVRGLIAVGRLPSAPSQTEQLDVGLLQLRALSAQDVLVMGDSQFATGLDPEVLDRLVERALGRAPRVYDLAQPASTIAQNRALLELLAAEGRMPRVVLMDVSMASLAREEDTSSPEAASRGGRSLDAAGRSIFFDSALGAQIVGCGSEEELVDRLDCELGRISAAWRWHGRPDRVVGAVLSEPGLRRKEARGVLRKDGFFARSPAASGVIERQVRDTEYDQDRIHPVFNRAEADDLRAFADLVEAAGGTLILVQVPLTPMYTAALEAQNPDWQAERRAALEQLAASVGRHIVPVERYGDWWSDASASDLNHLSAEAAKHFTRQLWDLPDVREPLLAALAGAVPGVSPAAGSPDPMGSVSPAAPPAAAFPTAG